MSTIETPPVAAAPVAVVAEKPKEPIVLSSITEALLKSIKSIKKKAIPDDLSKLSVSQAVSFIALLYEKVRNAVEYREEHLIRRAAIERILKRRLSMHPDGKNESENLLRELMWARYFPNDSLGNDDIKNTQNIIDKFIYLKHKLLAAPSKQNPYLQQFILDLITSEIEETLIPYESKRESFFTYFIYQILRRKVKVEGLDEDQKDAFFLTAIDQSYLKSDRPYQRYHLFVAFYQPISRYTHPELDSLFPKLNQTFTKIDGLIDNPTTTLLTRYVKKQLPPFLILFDIFRKKPKEIETIVSEKNRLEEEVTAMCNEKYDQSQKRLRGLAIRSLIYVFLTKMLFAIILEYPISLYLYNEVNWLSIAINTLFPPLLMIVIILSIRVPGEENTRKIFGRIIDIVDRDNSFETQIGYITKKPKSRRQTLIFSFSIIYILTFVITLFFINNLLNILHFNIISKTIFIFFVSVITFFSYRVRQVATEYRLVARESIITPIIDFFFLPILSTGKFLSAELGKLNFFIVIFDFIIEAPFKLIIDVFEEWNRFIKARKDEIV